MFKVNVLTTGKYDNVMTGERYILTKQKTKDFMNMLIETGCDFEVSKFVCCSFGFYCWSSGEAAEALGLND